MSGCKCESQLGSSWGDCLKFSRGRMQQRANSSCLLVVEHPRKNPIESKMESRKHSVCPFYVCERNGGCIFQSSGERNVHLLAGNFRRILLVRTLLLMCTSGRFRCSHPGMFYRKHEYVCSRKEKRWCFDAWMLQMLNIQCLLLIVTTKKMTRLFSDLPLISLSVQEKKWLDTPFYLTRYTSIEKLSIN